MTRPALTVKKSLLLGCLEWFFLDFEQRITSLLDSEFPKYGLPAEIQGVIECGESLRKVIGSNRPEQIDLAELLSRELTGPTALCSTFKQILLRYRRHRASETELLQGKTFHAGIIQTLREDIESLDAIAEAYCFRTVETSRLPRAGDFLPVQFIERSEPGREEPPPRLYDEKFHILQSPSLFFQDVAYFRARCETRDLPLTVAFLDIDDFKALNSANGETAVDRAVLPRFMRTLEAHVYHHGFAYRQGGDEYLVLLPTLSAGLAIAFLDELRVKLAGLSYPEVHGRTTVSIGLCRAEPDCPLTDRELLDRANRAKTFAKAQGKDRIASYGGPLLVEAELTIARPGA